MILPKHKNVRLHGKDLARFVTEVAERDGNHCILCGRPVQEGTKFHHVYQGSRKSDELDKVVLLCNECHFKYHHQDGYKEMKHKCLSYLTALYGVKEGE